MTLFTVLFAPMIASYPTGQEDWTLTSWFAEGRQLGGGCQVPIKCLSVHHTVPSEVHFSHFLTKALPPPYPSAFLSQTHSLSHCLIFQQGTNPLKEKFVCLFIGLHLWMLPTGRGAVEGLRVTPICYSVRCIQNSAWLKAELLRISSILLPGSKKWSVSYRGAVGLNLCTYDTTVQQEDSGPHMEINKPVNPKRILKNYCIK